MLRNTRTGATLCVASLLLATVAVTTASGSPSSSASASGHDTVVSTDAVPWTPKVLDGRMFAIEQVGTTMVAGGTFTSVKDRYGTVHDRSSIVAYDNKTGAVTPFAPELDGAVEDVAAGPTPGTLYVAGSFKNLDGSPRKAIVLLDLETGEVVPGWKPVYLNGIVRDVVLIGDRVIIGGTFTTLNGAEALGLASLDAATGQPDDWMDVRLTENHNWNGSGAKAPVGAEAFDVTPDGSTMVVIGNFKKADGFERDQAVLINLDEAGASVAEDWRTRGYEARCYANAFDSYMRDVEISPDGSYFVVATTGGPSTGTLCDAAARFDLADRGQAVTPTWVNESGGDSLLSVAVTPTAVYVGGHQRWANNPTGRDRANPGAVPRAGIAALSVDSGVPLAWNPGRHPRGAGAFTMLATETGLWVGSDTPWVGYFGAYRPRIAFFPLAGGSAVPSDVHNSLPGNVYVANESLDRRWMTTSGVEVAETVATDSDWSQLRGAFVVGDVLYHGASDGNFYKRDFMDDQWGPPVKVDPYNDPYWSDLRTGSGSSVYRGSIVNYYGAELSSVTGMAYDAGYVYYTRQGGTALYRRGFAPDSAVFGAAPQTVQGVALPTDVAGLMILEDYLWWGRKDGSLNRTPWNNGSPDISAAEKIGGPDVDGLDWAAYGLFSGPGAPPAANAIPTPALSSECSLLTCSFDATGSVDTDGEIVSSTWDFGDGETAIGATAEHTYSVAGTYELTLTVTDNRGGTATATRSITVSPDNVDPVANIVVTCDDLTCSFDGARSYDTDGNVVVYEWNLGDGTTAMDAGVDHTFAGSGRYDVQLTVRDDVGGEGSATVALDVTAGPADISFVGSNAADGTTAEPRVSIPAEVAPGDALLLFLTLNKGDAAAETPDGWQLLGEQKAGNSTTLVWVRTADAGDAGREVSTPLSVLSKADLTVGAYRGVDAANPINVWASAADTAASSDHTTPTVTADPRGSWVVSYWADKSSSTTEWMPPTGAVVRSESLGSGTGYVTALLADSGTAVNPGSDVGGLTASTNLAGSKATMWTIVLSAATEA